MRRRDFIALFGGAAAWPLAARAQQVKKMSRIGVLWPNPPATFEPMRQGLKDFGYVEGQNIAFEFRSPNWLFCGIPQIRRTNRRCRPSMPRADLYRSKFNRWGCAQPPSLMAPST